MFFIYGTNSNSSIKFITNILHKVEVVLYIIIYFGILDHPSIIVGESASLLLFNNSAFEEGALFITPSFAITAGYQSSIHFINNITRNVGGAVYSESAFLCVFTITDYTAKISFTENSAQLGVGHHMYGAARCEGCYM